MTTHSNGRPAVRLARACAREATHADVRTKRTITSRHHGRG